MYKKLSKMQLEKAFENIVETGFYWFLHLFFF